MLNISAGMLETFLRVPTLLTNDVMVLLSFLFHGEARHTARGMKKKATTNSERKLFPLVLIRLIGGVLLF
jgi:hypothetical protein